MTDRQQDDARAARSSGQRGSEIALLGILVTTAFLGFVDRLPILSAGIHLQVPDVLLLGSLACIAVRWLAVPEFRLTRTPLDLPLLAFYGVTIVSTLVAVVKGSVGSAQAIDATRVFSYYLTFFVITNLVRGRRQLDVLLNGILVLSTIVAVAMVGQYILGDSVQLLQNNQDLDITFGEVVRIAPPGFTIVMVSFVTVFCIMVCERFKPAGLLRFLQWGVMGVALGLTFFRSYWVALIAVLCLVPFLVRDGDRRRLFGWGAVIMFPLGFALLILFTVPDSTISRVLKGAWERLSTVGQSGTFTGTDESYDYRRIENAYAVTAIEANPLIGVGLGASFRPMDPRLDWRDDTGLHDLSNHIHNGHLGVLVQSGLLGYGSLMWLSVAFLWRGLRNWRRVPDARLRAVVLGFTLIYLAVLIAAGANSVFRLWHWTSVIGTIMGISEVILGALGGQEATVPAVSRRPATVRPATLRWTDVNVRRPGSAAK